MQVPPDKQTPLPPQSITSVQLIRCLVGGVVLAASANAAVANSLIDVHARRYLEFFRKNNLIAILVFVIDEPENGLK